jgi:cytosine/adenosine deaminase-related metal-dependent hydrolase
MKNSYLIKGLRAIYSRNETSEKQTHCDIEIRGNRISRIGPGLNNPSAREIDADNCVAIPGLANTHHHFYQVLTRAIPRMQDMRLFPWLVNHYTVWEGLTRDAVRWSSLVAMGELLLTGCTLTSDHHYLFPRSSQTDLIDLQFKAAKELGIRFVATRGSMSVGKRNGGLPPNSVIQAEKDILNDSRRLIDAYHNPASDSMQKVALAPCSPFSVSEVLMKQTAELARRHDIRLHTHLAETIDEQNYCQRIFKCRPVELMRRLDWLGHDVWFAHCVHLNSDEIELFASTGTAVAHCPSSNMRLGSGIAPVKELLSAGAPVGLAVDGSASNDSSDMLGELRQALFLQRVTKGADALSVDDVYQMGSRNGYQILGYSNGGTLTENALADIAVFSMDSLDFTGVHDPVGSLILAGNCHRAKHVFVDGKIVVENGHLSHINESFIMESANKIADDLVRTAIEKTGINYMKRDKN